MSKRRAQKEFKKLLRDIALELPVTYYETNAISVARLYPVNHEAQLIRIFTESNGDMNRIQQYIDDVHELANRDLQVQIQMPFPFLYNQSFNQYNHVN